MNGPKRVNSAAVECSVLLVADDSGSFANFRGPEYPSDDCFIGRPDFASSGCVMGGATEGTKRLVSERNKKYLSEATEWFKADHDGER